MNIDDYIIYDFDMAALVKLTDLNVRKLADTAEGLTVGGYFNLLSKFLSIAPAFSEAIKHFAENESDMGDWKKIEAMLALLTELGCDRFAEDLFAISNARGKGDFRLAAFLSGKFKGFGEFNKGIAAALLDEKSDETIDTNASLASCVKEIIANAKPLILAVDDSPAILEAVAAVLNETYKVFKLPKPMMLEKILTQMTPQLFLLDYHMPERNGFECITIIRSTEGCYDTPIIFLTSEGTIDNVSAAVALGACDFIVKPFNPEQLKEKVAKHIKN
ncbi:MAG: response regulator [Defluviitaleaceae bacterium]|nr:response regulator [Defluviitaleaceae bacterium]